MGKARNAPVKFTSIPRLELQAAVLSTPLNQLLREELDLNIDKTFYLTESVLVLHKKNFEHGRGEKGKLAYARLEPRARNP